MGNQNSFSFFLSNQISNNLFHILNLITGYFLSHCNPIMCNLLLPNAVIHTHIYIRTHALAPASQVPVLKLIAFPPLAGAEAEPQRSLERLSENVLQAPAHNL